MKKLLITGASGLIGRSLMKHCHNRFDVIGTYNTTDYKPDNSVLKKLNLTDTAELEQCLDAINPEVVIHTAAVSSISGCEKDPKLTEEVNYRASAQLAAFCVRKDIRLIYLSSDMVFNGVKGNYSEDDEPHPINQYGKSKYSAEEAIKGICQNYVIARLNLVYGKGDAVKKSFTDELLIANWSGKSYPVFKDQVRSPISLNAATRAIRELAEGNFEGVYHLGGLEPINRLDFAKKFISMFHLVPEIIEEADVPEELQGIYPMNTSFDVSKAKGDLKTVLMTIEEGLDLEYGKPQVQ
ncbi:SDR family oxidoreductase [bacterium]|nr:SDR family oxidoreductase [FCB group bacterium]MBL7190124.1 SDR family oxidoreductase [bacterium]